VKYAPFPCRPATTISHALKLFGGKYLKDITSWDIERYKKMRRETTKSIGKRISDTTIRKELLHLNRFFVLAGEWGLVSPDHNPVPRVKKPPESKGRVPELSEEEEAQLLEAYSPGIRPVVKFAVYTGCRRGEILGLKWDRVDMDNGFIYLDKTKTGEPRVVPLCETALEVLRAISNRNGYVFQNGAGKPYTCVRASFNRAKIKAGLNSRTFHDLRHVFASRLRRNGASLGDIGELLGHKDMRMTLRYAHLTPGHLKSVVGLMDRFDIQTATKTATGSPYPAPSKKGRAQNSLNPGL
jgi:integrase